MAKCSPEIYLKMDIQSSAYNWRANTQVGFWTQHYLECLILMIDYFISYTHI